MKVEIITESYKWSERNNYRSFLEVKVDGNLRATFIEGETEDNCLPRNCSHVYRIANLMRDAWSAGKRGESLEITDIVSDELS